VCGPEEFLAKGQTIDEFLKMSLSYSEVCVGNYYTEAVSLSVVKEVILEKRLASLVSGDVHFNAAFLVVAEFFGFNIIFYNNRFFSVSLLTGHFHFGEATQEEYQALYDQNMMWDFNTLQDAVDFCVDFWTNGRKMFNLNGFRCKDHVL